MRVLVVGCGSIGKRHVANLLSSAKCEKIIVHTKNTECMECFRSTDKIEFTPLSRDSEVDFSGHQYRNIDFAIVANETYKHIDTSIYLAEKGINLFVEKPLSHTLNKISTLRQIVEERHIKLFVAYNLRFLGALRYMKEQLAMQVIGDLYFAKIEVGSYLPSWRPGRDYRKSYGASREKGGGVALDLSHEIDYMRYLFGDPCEWKVSKTKVSNLEIDSDDVFEGVYTFDNNFICNVHMDYLQAAPKREIRIVGSEGVLACDLIDKYIKVTKNNEDSLIRGQDLFDINKTYEDELNDYINSIEEDREPSITLFDGIKTLELLEERNV